MNPPALSTASSASTRRFLQTHGRPILLSYFGKRAPAADAEDLAHDAFAKAWSRCGDLHDPARAPAWLIGIARNHLIDHLRRATRQSVAAGNLPLPDAEGTDGETEACRAQLATLLRQNLDLLPMEQRSVVAAQLEGERQVEIARRLGLPLPTVKARIQRARQRIRDHLASHCAFNRDAFGRVIDCEPRGPDGCR